MDLTGTDLVVGTSAGSVVGAQILSGTPVQELYSEQLKDSASDERGVRLGGRFMVGWIAAEVLPGGEPRSARRLGRTALRARTEPESRWLAEFERLVGAGAWPDGRLVVVAVDAEAGELRQSHRQSGVLLVDAL